MAPEHEAEAEEAADRGDDESLEDPQGAEEEEWPPERRERQLLRLLHDAVIAHLESGEVEPSLELEIALENARCELGST